MKLIEWIMFKNSWI